MPVIEAALDIVRPAAEAKRIRLQAILDSRDGLVSGDPNRLRQVLWNLISNAIKFTEKDGRVQIRLQRVNPHVEIVVSDTGPGISPDFLPYVFDRFTQASNATEHHSGLGLGLAITRHLVGLHGGTIQAYSPGEGQGSTFIVSLPVMMVHHLKDTASAVQQPQSTAEGEIGVATELPRVNGLQVLFVDNEGGARDVLTAILTQSGATVTTVASVAILSWTTYCSRLFLLLAG